MIIEKKFNRRGQVTWHHLFGGAIAVLVLVLMVWFIFFGGGEAIAKSIENILPGFGQDDTIPQEGVQVIGYNLLTNNVEYFTGKQWVVIGDKVVELGDKKVSGTELHGQFLRYYYGDYVSSSEIVSKPTKAEFLDSDTAKNLFAIENPSSNLLFDSASIKLEYFYAPTELNLAIGSAPGGSLSGTITYVNTGQVLVVFTVSHKGTFYASNLKEKGFFTRLKEKALEEYFFGEAKESPTDPRENVLYLSAYNFARNWMAQREKQALSQTIRISYEEDGRAKTDRFCVELIGVGAKLRVDLSEPVSSEEECKQK